MASGGLVRLKFLLRAANEYGDVAASPLVHPLPRVRSSAPREDPPCAGRELVIS
jgi:hypothetical protein